MQQLSGLDASFVYMETANTPMHIGSMCIYDQSSAPGGKVTFKGILKFYEERLHRARIFRQRLEHVPLSLDHPYWIEDPDFDLEYHIRHIALPKPGDWRQLCIQTARLHARPMDLKRPLWEVTVIEGLDNVEGVPEGSFALVTKVHHAAVDGMSGVEIAEALHDLSADGEVNGPIARWSSERAPTGLEMLARTSARAIGLPWRAVNAVRESLPGISRVVAGLATKKLRAPKTAPRTRFNKMVSPHRVFDAIAFSLDDIRAIRPSVPGATVNDVIVSVCGGAMRKYLLSKDELPEESLIAMAPVSTRSNKQKKSAGNLVSGMSLPVRSDIADPLKRLAAVFEASQEAKKMTYAVGPEIAAHAADFIPAGAAGFAMRAASRLKLPEALRPAFNTVITNVPGPNVPLYSMGTRMVANYGLGPPVHGLGLFHPVVGYNGKIRISVIACREMMPDPAFYIGCLQEAFDELQAAAAQALQKRAAPIQKATKKPARKAKKVSKAAAAPEWASKH